ncbi:RagB/SusD family nutrient uptake outer membrane protein [Aliifodinibius sp. S!AR15-10]|uniref:RagB/SusD family nutrient uptake outer membrane protein n=1 Tax=Aliifodinibius sp. S!AR15-10 TaxID=2950437 RepID=UPI00285F78BA|nr:RagB/SusD family nutrient uptake outer membrane protein [Aliifodinibius sp. S!AR15-10]MDR8393799.1 RagB/SusD family nutrient uptake outer membrane protein [Aliifodinibius sp. S!AR15-10]
MKTLKYILLITLVFTIGACEDFLNKTPNDQPTESTFWQSQRDFEIGLTAIYGDMAGNGYPWEEFAMNSVLYPNLDNLTDNSYGQHNYGGSQQLVQGNITPTTGGYINDAYSHSYENIARVNIFLQNLQNFEGDGIGEEVRSDYEAQARFFRAFNYWKLYFFYGAVPVIKQPLTLENQNQPKNSAEEVFNAFLEDVNFAINNLEDVHYSENGGHLVKASAQALKARALLYNGYDSNGNPQPQILEQVRDITQSIMQGGYSLATNYVDVFREGTQEGNPEIIFSAKYLAPDKIHHGDQMYGDWLVVSPLPSFVDSYEASDGEPIDQSAVYDPENPFENRDARLTKTVFRDGPSFEEGGAHSPTNDVPTEYGLKKFLEPGHLPYGYATLSDQDWVIFRYAEIMLMYAEAQNELNGPNESVHEAINPIRNRAGLPDLDDNLTQAEMREKIRHERRIELAFEGLRYYDLKRWRIAEEVLNNVDDGILSYTFEEKHYLWPLPQSQIDQSNGELEQNPDY